MSLPNKYDTVLWDLVNIVNIWRDYVPQIYNSSGLLNSPKIWVGTATTNGSGAWTVDISSAGFSSISSVSANSVDNAGTAITESVVTVKTVSTSSITGAVVKGLTAVLASPTLTYETSGIPVHVTVYGN